MTLPTIAVVGYSDSVRPPGQPFRGRKGQRKTPGADARTIPFQEVDPC